MNEFDIVNDLTICIADDCDNCHRCEEGGSAKCVNQLLKDARAIIQMQADALKAYPPEIEKLKEEIARLTPFQKFNFDEVKLVNAVNEIIRDCYMVDWEDYEDGGNNYVAMLKTILAFAKLVPSSYKVRISGIKDAPKLVKE